MLSRITSPSALVILTPFSKAKICCHRSEDARAEFRRLEYLNLRTIVRYGTAEQAKTATEVIARSYGPGAQARESPAVLTKGVDLGQVVDQLQRSNAVLIAPNIRRGKLPVTTAGVASASRPPGASSSATAIPASGGSHSLLSRPPGATTMSSSVRRPRKRKLDDSTPVHATKRRKT
jgi:hypothetical protein